MRARPGLLVLAVLTLAACPPAKSTTAGSSASGVDPDGCGNLSTTDVGRKLHAFLVATVELDRQVSDVEQAIRGSCKTMGAELQMPAGDLDGPTKELCGRVLANLKLDLQAGMNATPLVVQYTPGQCTVDADAAGHVAAQCEAQASGTASVTCEGSCTGTCHGTCNGTCSAMGANNECNGRCSGTCEGSCTGGCTGAADVHASAECKAQAEVHASLTMQCTDPQLNVQLPQVGVVDAAKANLALNAIRKGMPKILWAAARAKPLAHAAEAWATAAGGMADSGEQLASQFAERAICVGGQIAAAVAMVAHIQASFSVSVEISVQAQGTVGASG
jgi:modification target Cys-rich repeat protein